jgi:hypothetical protein
VVGKWTAWCPAVLKCDDALLGGVALPGVVHHVTPSVECRPDPLEQGCALVGQTFIGLVLEVITIGTRRIDRL